MIALSSCSKDETAPAAEAEVLKTMTVTEIQADFSNELVADNFVEDFTSLRTEIPEVTPETIKEFTDIGKRATNNTAQKTTADTPLCDRYYKLNASTTAKLGVPDICGVKAEMSIDLESGNVYGCYKFPEGGACTRNDKSMSNLMSFRIGTDGLLHLIFDNFKFGDQLLTGEMTLNRAAAGKERITILKNLVVEEAGQYKVTRNATFIEKPVSGTNDFELTYESTTTFPDGGKNIIKVTKPMYTKTNCANQKIGDGRVVAVFGKVVAGEIEMRMRGNVVRVDFGDKTCDAIWKIKRDDGTEKILTGTGN